MCSNGDICAMKQAYIAKIERRNDLLKQDLIKAKEIVSHLLTSCRIYPDNNLEWLKKAEEFLKEGNANFARH